MVQKTACIVQANVFNVFLHAEVDVGVYMHHPPGFPGTPNTVYKIKKGLYGMHHLGLIKYSQLLINSLVFIMLKVWVFFFLTLDFIR